MKLAREPLVSRPIRVILSLLVRDWLRTPSPRQWACDLLCVHGWSVVQRGLLSGEAILTVKRANLQLSPLLRQESRAVVSTWVPDPGQSACPIFGLLTMGVKKCPFLVTPLSQLFSHLQLKAYLQLSRWSLSLVHTEEERSLH